MRPHDLRPQSSPALRPRGGTAFHKCAVDNKTKLWQFSHILKNFPIKSNGKSFLMMSPLSLGSVTFFEFKSMIYSCIFCTGRNVRDETDCVTQTRYWFPQASLCQLPTPSVTHCLIQSNGTLLFENISNLSCTNLRVFVCLWLFSLIASY